VFRPALWPTQLPIKWISGGPFPRIKLDGGVRLTTHPIYYRNQEWLGAIPAVPWRLHGVAGQLYFTFSTIVTVIVNYMEFHVKFRNCLWLVLLNWNSGRHTVNLCIFPHHSVCRVWIHNANVFDFHTLGNFIRVFNRKLNPLAHMRAYKTTLNRTDKS
jgi:hypothetical protein